MKQKSYLTWIIVGAVLIISALLLVFVNTIEDNKSGNASKEALSEVVQMIADNSQKAQSEREESKPQQNDIISEYAQDENEEEEEQTVTAVEETIITHDGREYIGVISIPSLGIELPVQSSLNYDNLDVSPCRYSGKQSDGNLIIAAHNYRSHFREIDKLVSGDEIYFTDALGNVFLYIVTGSELIDGRLPAQMDIGADDEWNLTLFTCNYSGYSRVTVRAALDENYLAGGE